MKTLAVIIGILGVTVNLQGQVEIPELLNYGAAVTTSYTGSGHGQAAVISLMAANNKKSFEIGVILDNARNSVKGIDFRYKIFVNRAMMQVGNAWMKPFVNYNMVYQKQMVRKEVTIATESVTETVTMEKEGKIATIEHYIGTGLHLQLVSGVFAETNIGIGSYRGSLQNEKPNTIGIHKTNSGYTIDAKLTVGIMF